MYQSSQKSNRQQYSSAATATKRKISKQLETPDIIYSNNHLLVVNKPAGWKSQPGNGGGSSSSSAIDPKCLLTYLKSQSLGGGSNKDFLIPTHRLDQPCSGVLIFAKNGKAASRVQVAWARRNVKKTYWVVVEGNSQTTSKRNDKMNGLELLIKQSTRTKAKNIYKLSAILKSTKGKNARGNRRSNNNNAGGSVLVKPLPPNYSSLNDENSKDGRVCHIEWKHLRALSGERHLLSVTTDTGAKHQVRALLALAGRSPISGDLRYGNNHNTQFYNNAAEGGRVDQPLLDGSVALHARSVSLPTVSLGGMEFLKDEPFVGSIPSRWKDFFGLSEDDVRQI